jgi:tRNA(Ile)-lysidine synthase
MRNGGTTLPRDDQPIPSSELSVLFADLAKLKAIALAVSGGPDSTALLWLIAKWRRRLRAPPGVVAITIDHRLRKESAAEARAVKQLAATLDIPHTTLRWSGAKPLRGLPAAAREARYAMLAKAARKAGANIVLTAHTRDDQAETFMMRLSRGSGLAGLASMPRYLSRGDLTVVRPLLNVPKARLIATLRKAGVSFADDPTNRDTAFTRPRWRQLMPQLAREGLDARGIERLVARLARANAALEAVADRAERTLVRQDGARRSIAVKDFATLPQEIRLRILQRTIDRVGHEGPAELGKLETLLDELSRAAEGKPRPFRRTLAGALIGSVKDIITIEPAPPRRTRPRRP